MYLYMNKFMVFVNIICYNASEVNEDEGLWVKEVACKKVVRYCGNQREKDNDFFHRLGF